MKLSEKQIVFSLNISYLIAYANSIGIGMTFGDAYRPQELQLLYFHGYNVKWINNSLKLIKTTKKSK